MKLFFAFISLFSVLTIVKCQQKLLNIALTKVSISVQPKPESDIFLEYFDGKRIVITVFHMPSIEAGTELTYPYSQFSHILDSSKIDSIVLYHQLGGNRTVLFNYFFRNSVDFITTFPSYDENFQNFEFDLRIMCVDFKDVPLAESFAFSIEYPTEFLLLFPMRFSSLNNLTVFVNDKRSLIQCDTSSHKNPAIFISFITCVAIRPFLLIQTGSITVNIRYMMSVNGIDKTFNNNLTFPITKDVSERYIFTNSDGFPFTLRTNYTKIFDINGMIQNDRTSIGFGDLTFNSSLSSCNFGEYCQLRNFTQYCQCLNADFNPTATSATITQNPFENICVNFPRNATVIRPVTCEGLNRCVNGNCSVSGLTTLCSCFQNFTGDFCEIDCTAECESGMCVQDNDTIICICREGGDFVRCDNPVTLLPYPVVIFLFAYVLAFGLIAIFVTFALLIYKCRSQKKPVPVVNNQLFVARNIPNRLNPGLSLYSVHY